MRNIVTQFTKRKIPLLFYKVFTTMLCFTTLFIILVALVIYGVSKQSLENEVSRSNLDTLRQTRNAVDSIIESTERISTQLMTNQKVQQFLQRPFKVSNSGDVETIRDVVNTTETLLEGAQYIEKMSVYSFLNNAMISSGTGAYREMDRTFEQIISGALQKRGGISWLEPKDSELDVLEEGKGTVRLLNFIYGMGGKPQGFILVQLKNDEFLKLVQNIYIRKSGYIVLLDAEGNEMVGGSRSEKENRLKTEWIIGAEGYRKVQSGSQSLLVSYTTSRHNQWKYVTVLPADELENKAYVIGNFIILLCIVFTLLSIGVSFAVTRGIYNPILLIESVLKGESPGEGKLEKLNSRKDEIGWINREINHILRELGSEKNQKASVVEENSSLKEMLDDNISKLKNYFLYRLVCGDISDEQEIRRQAAFMDIPLEADYITVMVDFGKNFDAETADMDSFQRNALLNGVQDIFESALSNAARTVKVFSEGSEAGQRVVGIFRLEGKGDAASKLHSLRVMCNYFLNIISRKFNLVGTVTAGKIYHNLQGIRRSYEEAHQSLKYKFIMGSGAVIFKSDVEEDTMQKNRQMYYKKHLRNCLEAGNTEEIKKVLESFKESLKEDFSAANAYAYYCKDIINILIEFFGGLDSISSKEISDLNQIFLEFEKEFDNIDQAVCWIISFIEDVFEKRGLENQPRLHRLVQKALDIIEVEYHTDLSLSYLAERLQVTEQYLSRIFKEEGKNFKDYLISYRLEKAKELLRATKIPIQEVAAQVGYNSADQFARMFKKREGITPAEFRNLSCN